MSLQNLRGQQFGDDVGRILRNSCDVDDTLFVLIIQPEVLQADVSTPLVDAELPSQRGADVLSVCRVMIG